MMKFGTFQKDSPLLKLVISGDILIQKENGTFSQVEITAAKQNAVTANVETKNINSQEEETEEVSEQPKEIIITMNAHSDASGAMSNLSGSYGVYQTAI